MPIVDDYVGAQTQTSFPSIVDDYVGSGATTQPKIVDDYAGGVQTAPAQPQAQPTLPKISFVKNPIDSNDINTPSVAPAPSDPHGKNLNENIRRNTELNSYAQQVVQPMISGGEWVKNNEQRVEAGTAGAINTSIKNWKSVLKDDGSKFEDPVAAAWHQAITDKPEMFGPVLQQMGIDTSKGSGLVATTLANMAFDPLMAVGVGEYNAVGKLAQKADTLLPGALKQLGGGQRSLATAQIPFTGKTVDLVPGAVNRLAAQGIGKAGELANKVPFLNKAGQIANNAFVGSSGNPEVDKMVTREFDRPQSRTAFETEKLQRETADKIKSVAKTAGVSPDVVSQQILHYNGIPAKYESIAKRNPELAQHSIDLEQTAFSNTMHPDTLKLADERAQVFKGMNEKDITLGQTYKPRAGYEPQIPTAEFREWGARAKVTNNRANQKVYSDFFQPAQQAKLRGMTVPEHNAFGMAGDHPQAPGFKGKIFEDDAAKTLAARNQKTETYANVKNLFTKAYHDFGMSEDSLLEAKKAGTIHPEDWEKVTSETLPGGKAYFPHEVGDVLKSRTDFGNSWQKSFLDNWRDLGGAKVNTAFRIGQVTSVGNAFRDIFPTYLHNFALAGYDPATIMKNFARVFPLIAKDSTAYKNVPGIQKLAKNFSMKTPEGVKNGEEALKDFSQGTIGHSYIQGLSNDAGGPGGVVSKGLMALPNGYRALRTPVEDAMRAAFHVTLAEDGYKLQPALDMVDKHAYNWSKLTPTERVMREADPFYVWMRKNGPYQVKQWIQHPAQQSMVLRGADTLNQQPGSPDRKYMKSDSYMNRSATANVGKMPNAPNQSWNLILSHWFPQFDPFEMTGQGKNIGEIAANTPRAAMTYALQNASPIAGLTNKWYTNQNPQFGNEPLEKWSGQKVPLGPFAVSPLQKEALTSIGPVGAYNTATTDKTTPLQKAMYFATKLKSMGWDNEKAREYYNIQLKKDLANYQHLGKQEMNKMARNAAEGKSTSINEGNIKDLRQKIQDLRSGKMKPSGY